MREFRLLRSIIGLVAGSILVCLSACTTQTSTTSTTATTSVTTNTGASAESARNTGAAAATGAAEVAGQPEASVTGSPPSGSIAAGTDADDAVLPAFAPPTAIDADGLQAQVARQSGRVVLVDFWATWCGPCKSLFPHSAALAGKLQPRGLSVFTVSLDDADAQEAVAEFLQRHLGPMTHFLSTSGAEIESFESFQIEGGSIPYFKLYDRTGRLRYQFAAAPPENSELLDIDQLDAKIDELLAEPAPSNATPAPAP